MVQNKNGLEQKQIQDIVKAASKRIGTQQLSLADILEDLVLKKAQEILPSLDHPLSKEFVPPPSG